MSRSDPFGLENESQDHRSPGPIQDDERICRGGFDPMHYTKGKPKNSIIRADDLLTGSLSVWRGGTGDQPDFDLAVAQISKTVPAEQNLRSVFAPIAAEIRDIQLDEPGRVFYVVDDCSTDENGGFHVLHAGIKICPSLNIASKEDDLFLKAKGHLLRVLKKTEIMIAA